MEAKGRSLDRPEIIQFGNGLRLALSIRPGASVSIWASVGVGSRYEDNSLAGASHFLEHLLFKGTTNRPLPFDLSSAIESSGGILNASTEREVTAYWCKVLASDMENGLNVIFDMLMNPLLKREDVEKERDVIIEEINMINDYPNYKAESLMDEILWPDHPLGRDIAGTKASLRDISREDLISFHRKYYRPVNTVVSIAGHVDRNRVIQCLEELTSDWDASSGSDMSWTFPSYFGVQKSPRLIIDHRETEQTHLSLGFKGVSFSDDRKYVMDLLSAILGEGMSSRLFVELRENKGLTYDIRSANSYYADTGCLFITAGVDHDNAHDAISSILNEVFEIQSNILLGELERAKSYYLGRLRLYLEDTRNLAEWAGYNELLLNSQASLDSVERIINIIQIEDVESLAKEVFRDSSLNLAIVGPSHSRESLDDLLTGYMIEN